MPNKTQYIAPNIGSGIDANKAPNFPENAQGKKIRQNLWIKRNLIISVRVVVRQTKNGEKYHESS